MKFSRNRLQGMDSIEIAGPFDANDRNIDEAVRDIVNEGKTNLVFDLSRTSYLTSPGVAVLIKAIKQVRSVNGTVYVYGATPDVKEFLMLSRIDSFVRFI
jgi:anti-anti-sigma factor